MPKKDVEATNRAKARAMQAARSNYANSSITKAALRSIHLQPSYFPCSIDMGCVISVVLASIVNV
jgi:hypothetical protein